MAIRKIIYLPDQRLRNKSVPIKKFDNELLSLVNDMFDTMYDAKGVGLAAPQIGINIRLSVIDVTPDKSRQIVIANPQIIESSGETVFQEGCLSVPGAYDNVTRATKVKVKAQNEHGEFFEIEAEGLLSECLQHEIDHLNGKLFIDLLSPLKRTIARRKLEKFKRQQLERAKK